MDEDKGKCCTAKQIRAKIPLKATECISTDTFIVNAPLVNLHKGADDIDADNGLAPDPQDGDFSPGDQLPQCVPANAGAVGSLVYRHAEFPSPKGLHSRGAPAVRQLNNRITHSPVSSFETGQPRRKMLCPHNIRRAVFRRG